MISRLGLRHDLRALNDAAFAALRSAIAEGDPAAEDLRVIAWRIENIVDRAPVKPKPYTVDDA